MKKLLVFTLVVSMLAFAGCAWAADSDSGSHGTLTPEQQAGQAVTGVTGYEELTEEEVTAVEEAIADAIRAGMIADAAVKAYNTIVQTAESIAQVARNPLPSAISAAADANTDGVPAGSSVLNVSDLVSSGAVTVEAPEATTAAAFLKIASDPNVVAFPAPKLTVDSTVADGAVLQTTMYTGVGGFDSSLFANVKKLVFYPDPLNYPNTTSTNMWLVYQNPGETEFKTLTANSTEAEIKAVKDGATILQRFIYSANSNTGVRGAAKDENGNTVYSGGFVADSTGSSSGGDTETPVLGGSGGGCVAGSSALALAVLGLFIAKRRG